MSSYISLGHKNCVRKLFLIRIFLDYKENFKLKIVHIPLCDNHILAHAFGYVSDKWITKLHVFVFLASQCLMLM